MILCLIYYSVATGQFGHASHRARIPAFRFSAGSSANSFRRDQKSAQSVNVGQALDIKRAVFLERSLLGDVLLHERWCVREHTGLCDSLICEESIEIYFACA